MSSERAGAFLTVMTGLAFGVWCLSAVSAFAQDGGALSTTFCVNGLLWEPAKEVAVVSAPAREFDFGERFAILNQKLFGSERLKKLVLVDAYTVADKSKLPKFEGSWIAIEQPKQATPWWKIPIYTAQIVKKVRPDSNCDKSPTVKFLAPLNYGSVVDTPDNAKTRFVVESVDIAEAMKAMKAMKASTM